MSEDWYQMMPPISELTWRETLVGSCNRNYGHTMSGSSDSRRGHSVTTHLVAAMGTFVLLQLLLANVAHGATPSSYEWGSAGDWVKADLPGVSPGADSQLTANPFQIVDYQIRVTENGSENYRHIVRKLGNSATVGDSSQITIDFDPTVERLTLHQIRVQRGSTFVDEKNTVEARVLQRESELESGVLTGIQTLSLLLHDTRVGDVLEYAFTLTRTDSLQAHRFSYRMPAAWGESVQRLRVRLLYPVDRTIRVFDRGELGTPTVSRANGWTEMTWFGQDVPAVDPEPSLPRWLDVYPNIEWTEFPDWEAVRAWARPLFSVQEVSSPALLNLIQRLSALADETSQIDGARQFVQEGIRYTGIEIGEGAYRPSSPNEVLARGYGDCKEKVLLFVTLLRALHIRADPALVSIDWGEGIEGHAPRPGLFDHAIVRVQAGGQTYWLDVTRTAQGKRLGSAVQADFGRALVIDSDSGGLASIKIPALDAPLIEASERYNLSQGLYQPARLTVTTIYRGTESESLRSRLRRTTAAAIGRDFLNYYQTRFPETRSAAELQIRDDVERNELTLTEQYNIPKVFVTGDDAIDRFNLEAFLVTEKAVTPNPPTRRQPLAIDHPLWVRQNIDVMLPDEWPVQPSREQITAPGLSYTRQLSRSGATVKYAYELASTRDRVEPTELAQYRKKVQDMRDDSFQVLYRASPSPKLSLGTLAWQPVLAFLGGLLVTCALAWQLWHAKGRAPREPEAGAPVGLGGWLILVGIGVVLSPFLLSSTLGEFRAYFANAVYSVVGNQFSSGWRSLVLKVIIDATIFLTTAQIVLSVLLVALFFTRHRLFPLMYVVLRCSEVLLIIFILVLLVQLLGGDSKGVVQTTGALVRSIIQAAIWCTYMLMSKRVRATFTREGRIPMRKLGSRIPASEV
jgi:transglutaminase-like putative cysteine protease